MTNPTLPKHTKIDLVTVYNETINTTMIPMSIKGTLDVESYIETMKIDLTDSSDVKLKYYRKLLEIENNTDEELFDAYVESKIAIDLSKLDEEVTEKRIKSLKVKRFDKLIEGKTRESIINESADMLLDAEIRKQILNQTVSRTLWNVLRVPEDLRSHTFKDVDELNDSIDSDTLIKIFTDIEGTKVSDEDLKN